MCNRLHPNSKPIPEKGIGYKIFEKNKKGDLTAFYECTPYKINEDGWIEYSSEVDPRDVPPPNPKKGFAFLNGVNYFKQSAGGPIDEHSIVQICQIEYEGGLGSHEEKGMNWEKISLCRRFRISKVLVEYDWEFWHGDECLLRYRKLSQLLDEAIQSIEEQEA